MGRRCSAEDILEVEDGIDKVMINHRKSRHGTQTTEKAVLVVIHKNLTVKPVPSKQSKKKGKVHQPDSDIAGGPEMPINTIADSGRHANFFTDEQVDDFPDLDEVQTNSQTNVHVQSIL